MVLRSALLAIGVLELLRPKKLVDFWMRLAAKGGQDVELRSWVYAAARLEGLCILLWLFLQRSAGDDA
ncbi:hypothetical protein [Halocalculus aciditolerans]|uniref:Uncharacterized protein n=1 Tax=Halocalculus aciditolerans TaxID=1383812 RepID=A0A830FF29_9EURY|nr:hypothetical protein [Halocalculus aciditolerans]GGL69235.1 hypothetical protein GCM10009039_29000 [Halocalculus aciditolerans]